ncbi:MAG: hypothetical protein JWN40_3344 [Phycisphaerales bacterium]|nr:hypothetical protein [Phycisphaerales bacterium]
MDTPLPILPPFIPRKPIRYRHAAAAAAAETPPPPPGPPTLLSVTLVDGATVRLTFSAPVSIDPDPGPLDGNFQVGGQAPDAVAAAGAAQVDVTFTSGAGEGDPWSLDAQPNWLITVVQSPASGTVE